jgi:AcrR family transcriptional regulator
MASASSRDRMVQSAAALIARRGATATSFSEVLEHSGAPRGSIYHHFPGGKDEMTAAAMALVADYVARRQQACQATTPAEVLDCFIGMWREVVVQSGGTAGCAIAGTAVDAENDALVAAARAAFRQWTDLLAAQFAAAGLDRKEAAALATVTVAALEGGLILCRTERSAAPLDVVATYLAKLLPDAPPRGAGAHKRKGPAGRPGR